MVERKGVRLHHANRAKPVNMSSHDDTCDEAIDRNIVKGRKSLLMNFFPRSFPAFFMRPTVSVYFFSGVYFTGSSFARRALSEKNWENQIMPRMAAIT